jgi:hypothetical protein
MLELDGYCGRLSCCFAAMLFVLLLGGCSPARRITVKEAKAIADNQLAAFCGQEGLKVSQFSKAKMLGPTELSGVQVWVFQYQFIGGRDAKLEILVGEYGSSEIGGIGRGIPSRGKRR